MDTNQSAGEDRSGDTSRRSVLLGLGAGAAGAVIGGTGSVAAQGESHSGNDNDNEHKGDRGHDDGKDEYGTYVRAAHMDPGIPAVTATVDDEEIFEGVQFGSVTDYAGLAPGVREFAVRASEMNGPVFNARAALGPGAFTVVALQDTEGMAPIPLLLQDDLGHENGLPEQAQGKGKAKGRTDGAYARLVHAVADAPPVTVTTGGGRTLFEDVQFAEATTFMQVPSGSRTVQIRPADDGDTVLAEFSLSLEDGNSYTVFAAPDDPIDPVVVQDAIEQDD